jgi:hypothetical protein
LSTMECGRRERVDPRNGGRRYDAVQRKQLLKMMGIV